MAEASKNFATKNQEQIPLDLGDKNRKNKETSTT